MSKLSLFKIVGSSLLTTKRSIYAALAVAGLYMFGGAASSYMSTATRLVSDSVHESLPLEFEIERAKTMMNGLLPEIKRNMIAIAKEEAGVKTLRQEIDRDQAVLERREVEIKKFASLLEDTPNDEKVHMNSREVDRVYAMDQLGRTFERFKWDRDTLQQRMRLLDNQNASLSAAKLALEEKMNAKRDVEAELENLDARLFTVQRESATSNISFDETKLSRCQGLVRDLRARLDVAEHLVASGSPIEFGASSKFFATKDVLIEIDEFFSGKAPVEGIVKVER